MSRARRGGRGAGGMGFLLALGTSGIERLIHAIGLQTSLEAVKDRVNVGTCGDGRRVSLLVGDNDPAGGVAVRDTRW